ncbi:MAG: hypothetical protein KC561_01975, partial [Myxococcales bacterium]|nr:hypothetical protein [Myxococcales bacterium]
PYFESFEHDLRPIVLEELPLIEDQEDIDGDDDDDEMIADYENFDEVELRPDVAQQLRTEVVLPQLISIGGAATEFAIVVTGTSVPGAGFVPMGLNAATEEDGELGELLLRSAPPHSGLDAGDYAVLALTFATDDVGFGAGGIDLPQNLSGRLFVAPNLPTRVVFDGSFPVLPEDSEWNENARELTIDDVSADLYRVRLVSTEGTWTIYSADPGSITLPTLEGLPDPATMPTIRVEALFTADVSLDELVSPNDATLRSVDAAVTGFGRFVFQAENEEQ